MATYTSEMRPDGTMLGEGQGVSMGTGGEVATWQGGGIGVATGKGMEAKWCGAIYYSTPTEARAVLNSSAVVYEFDVAFGFGPTGVQLHVSSLDREHVGVERVKPRDPLA